MKKKHNSFLVYIVLILTTSCSSDPQPSNQTVTSPTVLESSTFSHSTLENGRMPEVQTYNITLAANGEYISSYGGGITFGTSFPHPTTVDATGATDGEPIIGVSYVAFQAPLNTLYSTLNGNKFSIAQPSFPEAVTVTEVTEYFTKIRKYWEDKTGTVPRPPLLSSSKGAGNVIEARGQIVRDHNSPTNASVVIDSYVYTPSTSVNNYVHIGVLIKNGYTFYFYSENTNSSGSIIKVMATNRSSNVTTTLSTYSLTYSEQEMGYLVVGTATLANGTVISFNNVTSMP